MIINLIRVGAGVLGSLALSATLTPAIIDKFKLNNKKSTSIPSEDIEEEDLDDED